jgi:hypothetical protein
MIWVFGHCRNRAHGARQSELFYNKFSALGNQRFKSDRQKEKRGTTSGELNFGHTGTATGLPFGRGTRRGRRRAQLCKARGPPSVRQPSLTMRERAQPHNHCDQTRADAGSTDINTSSRGCQPVPRGRSGKSTGLGMGATHGAGLLYGATNRVGRELKDTLILLLLVLVVLLV